MISRALLNAPFFIPKDADLLRNRKVNTKKRQNRHLPELAFLILGTYFTAPFPCFLNFLNYFYSPYGKAGYTVLNTFPLFDFSRWTFFSFPFFSFFAKSVCFFCSFPRISALNWR